MADIMKIAGATTLSTLLIAAAGTSHAFALEGNDAQTDQGDSPSAEAPESSHQESTLVALDTVEGEFDFTQGEVDCKTMLLNALSTASKYLCASTPDIQDLATADAAYAPGTITVKGTVENTFSASLEELANESDESIVLGCACAGDPTDGKSHANVKVKGVTVRSLLERAQISANTNTIVFASQDGYEVALPLSYLLQRHSVIVYEMNDEAVDEVLGCSNQLWLGSTSARYFGKDIVSIELREEATPPPAPGLQEIDGTQNIPNISISKGEAQ